MEKLSPWGKTYAVAKYKPDIIYLGNSRTEVGLPTDMSIFSGKKVFNSAISGATIGDAIALAKHVGSVSRPETVVWGIDYASFSLAVGSTDLDRDLISDTPDYYFLHRAVMDIKRALTYGMTRDSIKVLFGSFGSVCRSSLALNGKRDDMCIDDIITTRGGTEKVIEPRIREFSEGALPTKETFREFQNSVKELCNNRTNIRLYINPTHALMLDALYWGGKWDSMEAWQRSLVEIVDAARQRGCDIRLFDFSGFNSITTEAIPQASNRKKMENYWETSHYRSNVGTMVLERMFNPSKNSVPEDFGVELYSEMLPEHFKRSRLARDKFHINRPIETQFVKKLISGIDERDKQ